MMAATPARPMSVHDHDRIALIDDLPMITLEELLRLAPLMSRVDRKYVVPVGDLTYVLQALGSTAQVLQIDRRREFGYRSIYFDTPELDSYRSTVHRRRRRFKIRTRTYLDSGLHVLELKTRGIRGLTTKLRLPYDGDGLTLTRLDRGGLDPVLEAAHVDADPRDLVATLGTSYRRTTLYLPHDRDRVTIDHDLTWRLPDGASAAVEGLAVVEIKSSRPTAAADRLLWSMGIRPAVLSKYGTGLALLRPDLPATPWTPILRRHLTRHLRQDARS